MDKRKTIFFVLILVFIYIILVVFLVSIKATENFGVAVVGAATMIGATGVVVAFGSIESYRREARLQRTYEIIDKYVDNELKTAEHYLKYQFAIDRNANKFDFSQGLISSKGAKVELYNSEHGKNMVYEINYIIQKVTNFYCNLGIMAAYEMIDSDLIYVDLGTDLLILWSLLRPILVDHDSQRREDREPRLKRFHRRWQRIPYQAGFAYLVQGFEKAAPSDAACRLMNRDFYSAEQS